MTKVLRASDNVRAYKAERPEDNRRASKCRFNPTSYASKAKVSLLPSGTMNHPFGSRSGCSLGLSMRVIQLDSPRNQQELTDFVTRWTSATSNVTSEVVQGDAPINATYNIWTQLCVPTNGTASKTVELAVHGIGPDHSYWTLGGRGSKYNYVEAALKAGRAILVYDRLGVGKSAKPDGISKVQTATEVEIAAQLAKYLRGNPQGHNFSRVIGIGHSYGSVQLVGVAGKYGNLLDATILTGFSTSDQFVLPAIATFGWEIASLNNPKRFGGLQSSYITPHDISNIQQNFFRFGNYDPAILQAAEDTKWTATLGELLTQGASPAFNYTNPVLVVTGDKDYIFCGGNCYQKTADGSNLIEGSKVLFPNVSNFSTIIPAEVGHGINFQLNAADTYARINGWVAQLG
ncbi:hypothetical protein MD484_g3486, partial [Candolleomyces efflorescens]